MLQRAIYVSDATGEAGSNLLSFAEILGVSNTNNRRDHLTSGLMYHDGQFIQAIEGRRADLDRLIRRLKQDPRHCHLRFLINGPVDVRRHGEEPMACLSLNAAAHRILDGASLSDLDLVTASDLLVAAANAEAAAA